MFQNVGGKIKGLAKTVFVIYVIIFAIGALFTFINGVIYEQFELILLSFVIVGVGLLVAWLSTILLYAFGELVEKTSQTAANTAKLVEMQNAAAYIPAPIPAPISAPEQSPAPAHMWACSNCGNMIDGDFCPYCGTASRK